MSATIQRKSVLFGNAQKLLGLALYVMLMPTEKLKKEEKIR